MLVMMRVLRGGERGERENGGEEEGMRRMDGGEGFTLTLTLRTREQCRG